MDCVFCSIIKTNSPKHTVVWENEGCLAFLDSNPVTEGHTLVVPKKHATDILSLTKEEYQDLLLAAREIAEGLKNKMNCYKVSILIEGLSVPHVHIHLVPLQQGQDLIKFMRNK